MTVEKTLGKVQKAITTATNGVPGGLATTTLLRENLSGIVSRLSDLELNIRSRLARKQGSGGAASWNVLTALTRGNSAFAEGTKPTENDAIYQRRTAVYKELGKTKKISDRQIAAGRSFADQEAEQTRNAIIEVTMDEEQYIITGNSVSNPLQFDGMEAYVQTNVDDDANNALGYRPDLVDGAAETILSTTGARPTAVWTGYGMRRAINQYHIGDGRFNLAGDNDRVVSGTDVGFVQTMAGKLPLVSTFAIAGDSTTYSGYTVEDMYIVTERFLGEEVLYMEDLYALVKQDLGRTGAAVEFFVSEATAFINRAEEMQVLIENVRVK